MTALACSQEDGNAQHPDQAQLSCSPEPAHFIGNVECDQRSSDASQLYHGRDVAESIGLLCFRETFIFQSERLGETREGGCRANKAWKKATG